MNLSARKAMLLLLFMCFFSNLEAQDSLLYYNNRSHKISLDNKEITTKSLLKIMNPDQDAHMLLKSAQRCDFYSNVLYSLGFLSLGYQLLLFQTQAVVKWPAIAFGLGFIGVAVPINVKSWKQSQRAVNSFNNRDDFGAKFRNQFDLTLSLNSNGICLRLALP